METIIARGHPNITSKHKTTFEITKDSEISKRADCIIGVKANKGLKDLSEEFKKRARDKNSVIKVILNVGGLQETIYGRGHPELTFSHETDIVVRKSKFICPRTLMIKANKSSAELDRRLVELLKKDNQKLEMRIEII